MTTSGVTPARKRDPRRQIVAYVDQSGLRSATGCSGRPARSSSNAQSEITRFDFGAARQVSQSEISRLLMAQWSRDVDPDKPPSLGCTVAEAIGIAFTGATGGPGLACRHEQMPRRIGWIERDPAPLAQHFIHLRVAQTPALGSPIPIFANPMILPAVVDQIGRKAAAQPGRNPLIAQKAHSISAKSRQVPTLRRSGGRRSASARASRSSTSVRRSAAGRTLDLTRVGTRTIDAVGAQPIRVDEDALHDAVEGADARRQCGHGSAMPAGIGHGAVADPPFEVFHGRLPLVLQITKPFCDRQAGSPWKHPSNGPAQKIAKILLSHT